MGREEQIEELEVLDSIFPNEITHLDDKHFRITVGLSLPHEDDDLPKPGIVLHVAYPELYPDVAPDLDIDWAFNAPRPLGLDLATDKDHLMATLEPTIEESLGMAMVFNLVTTLQDAAERLMAERATVVEQALEAEKRAEDEKEDAKFHGEKVTPESFLRWREGFRNEKEEEARRKIEETEIAAKKGQKAAPVDKGEKLSGRQLWERGLVGKLDEEEEGDAVLPVEKGVEGLKVDG